jgi:hypothetical protein
MGKNVQIGFEFFLTMGDVELSVNFNPRIE